MSANPLTRRQWAVALAAAPALTAQAPAPSGGANPEQLLEQARGAVRQNREALRSFKLAADVEPVTVFRA